MTDRGEWLAKARDLFEGATRRETAELKALLCGIKTRFGLNEDVARVAAMFGRDLSKDMPLTVLIAFVIEGQDYLRLIEELEDQ